MSGQPGAIRESRVSDDQSRPRNPEAEKAWELYVEADKAWYRVASNTSYGFNTNASNRAAATIARERAMVSLAKTRDIKLMDYYIAFDKDQNGHE